MTCWQTHWFPSPSLTFISAWQGEGSTERLAKGEQKGKKRNDYRRKKTLWGEHKPGWLGLVWGLRSGKTENYHYSKKITWKTEGRQSFCLAVSEVQKARYTEHHTITETFS